MFKHIRNQLEDNMRGDLPVALKKRIKRPGEGDEHPDQEPTRDVRSDDRQEDDSRPRKRTAIVWDPEKATKSGDDDKSNVGSPVPANERRGSKSREPDMRAPSESGRGGSSSGRDQPAGPATAADGGSSRATSTRKEHKDKDTDKHKSTKGKERSASKEHDSHRDRSGEQPRDRAGSSKEATATRRDRGGDKGVDVSSKGGRAGGGHGASKDGSSSRDRAAAADRDREHERERAEREREEERRRDKERRQREQELDQQQRDREREERLRQEEWQRERETMERERERERERDRLREREMREREVREREMHEREMRERELRDRDRDRERERDIRDREQRERAAGGSVGRDRFNRDEFIDRHHLGRRPGGPNDLISPRDRSWDDYPHDRQDDGPRSRLPPPPPPGGRDMGPPGRGRLDSGMPPVFRRPKPQLDPEQLKAKLKLASRVKQVLGNTAISDALAGVDAATNLAELLATTDNQDDDVYLDIASRPKPRVSDRLAALHAGPLTAAALAGALLPDPDSLAAAVAPAPPAAMAAAELALPVHMAVLQRSAERLYALQQLDSCRPHKGGWAVMDPAQTRMFT